MFISNLYYLLRQHLCPLAEWACPCCPWLRSVEGDTCPRVVRLLLAAGGLLTSAAHTRHSPMILLITWHHRTTVDWHGVLVFTFYPPVKQFAWTQLTVYPHWQHTRFFVTFEDENFGQSLIKSILAQFETLEVSGIVKSSTVLEAATHKQVHKY